MSSWIYYYFIVINIVGIFIMKVDKQRARHHQYRVREKTLWMVAFLGGAVGTTLGMRFFRHKTKHLSFTIGFPLLAILDVILFLYLIQLS